eukprot:CAMPEP_0179314352 /NCGR_PEP_ID=MMETSP0797-20121207/54398_1 /TAXON_ID=47934 /ORGANISM="Dinophysis acuminata, Strain DAEP01" /LENGTH=36 /DNA_ID= /DNA_START= /DNA_END= /DNA_ORIENTATION=
MKGANGGATLVTRAAVSLCRSCDLDRGAAGSHGASA